MEDFSIFMIAVFAAVFIGVMCYFIGSDNPSGFAQYNTICEYEGGVVKADVCIKNNKVINLDVD